MFAYEIWKKNDFSECNLLKFAWNFKLMISWILH